MADRSGGETETVYCHECENRWTKTGDNITCPSCGSDFTEIIEPGNDPELDDVDDEPDTTPYSRLFPVRPIEPNPFQHQNPFHENIIRHPFNPFDHHAPWDGNPNVTRYEIRSAGPGATFTFTSASLRSPLRRTPPHPNHDAMDTQQEYARLFANILGPRFGHPGSPGSPRSPRPNPDFDDLPDPFVRTGRNHQTVPPPLAEFLGLLLGSPSGAAHPPGSPRAGDGLHAHDHGTPLPPGHPLDFLHALFNPQHAAAGDAVFTQEALDRIISQLMEQHNGSNAPGPASDAAISALPKKKVDKAMLGHEGTAECSICMDAVELGSEVVELPCKHWFHEECVASWLREHDTCPHCRKGIMDAVGENGNNSNAGSSRSRGWSQTPPPNLPNLPNLRSRPTRLSRSGSGPSSRQRSFTTIDGSRIRSRHPSDNSLRPVSTNSSGGGYMNDPMIIPDQDIDRDGGSGVASRLRRNRTRDRNAGYDRVRHHRQPESRTPPMGFHEYDRRHETRRGSRHAGSSSESMNTARNGGERRNSSGGGGIMGWVSRHLPGGSG